MNYTGASTRTNADKSLKSTLCLFLIKYGRHHVSAIFGTPHALHYFYNLCVYLGIICRNYLVVEPFWDYFQAYGV